MINIKNYYILIIFGSISFIQIELLAQEKIISGKVTDHNKHPLEYVNIGIKEKNIGTISNTEGNFNLAIPGGNFNDSLTFSMVGYKNKSILIKDITGFFNVQLSDTTYSIQTITVIPKQHAVLGPDRTKTGVSTGGLFEAGFEIGRVFESKNYPVKINSLNVYFRGSTMDTCTFRINFYNLKDGIPGDKILYQNIIFHGHYEKGWLTFNFEDKNLWIDQPFFASIEWIPAKDLNKKFGFWFGANMITAKNTYARPTSMGCWKKMKSCNIIMNVDLEF